MVGESVSRVMMTTEWHLRNVYVRTQSLEGLMGGAKKPGITLTSLYNMCGILSDRWRAHVVPSDVYSRSIIIS